MIDAPAASEPTVRLQRGDSGSVTLIPPSLTRLGFDTVIVNLAVPNTSFWCRTVV